MRTLLVSALGWLLAVAATGIALPQLVRVIRTRRDDGVSLRTCVLAAASMFAWAGYTLGRLDIPALASSLGPLVVWLSCGWIVARRRAVLARFAVASSVAAVAVISAGLLLGAFHVLAVTGSLLWILPQLQVVRRHDDLTGVSVAAYVLLAAENAAWVAYAWGTATPAYALAPLVQGPLGAVIAFYAWRAHRGRSEVVDDLAEGGVVIGDVELEVELMLLAQERLCVECTDCTDRDH